MFDPLNDLLPPASLCLPDDASRERLAQRTTLEVRRQRRLRRTKSVGALLSACTVGLLALLVLLLPGVPQDLGTPHTTAEIHPQKTPTDLEWQAIDTPEHAAALYRTAGEKYLAEADPANAIRCYGNALDSDGPGATDVNAEDDWLLMVIKIARRKENEAWQR